MSTWHYYSVGSSFGFWNRLNENAHIHGQPLKMWENGNKCSRINLYLCDSFAKLTELDESYWLMMDGFSWQMKYLYWIFEFCWSLMHKETLLQASES